MEIDASPDSKDDAKPVKSQAELDAFFARIDLLRAENEAKGKALIRKWVGQETKEKLDKLEKRSQADLDAEDARLFQPQPLYLGVGAAIPSDFLATEAHSRNKLLRNKFFPSTTLKASKARDAEEKAVSAKRGLKHDSSDEEEGRSGLGKAKKRQLSRVGKTTGNVNVKSTNPSLLQKEHPLVAAANTKLQDQVCQPDKTGQKNGLQDEMLSGQGQANGTIQPELEKKGHKKKKHKDAQITVESGREKAESAVDVHNPVGNSSKDSSLSTKVLSDIKTAKAHSPENDTSKEQRKKDKKARKEERRRLKRQEGTVQVV